MSRQGYTLVEILISVTLSLFLLLGITELFRRVGTSINDTQATLVLTRNLNWAAQTLRSDLAGLTEDPNKPSKLNGPNAPGDSGYIEIIEGIGVPYGVSTTHVSSTVIAKDSQTGAYDNTVGDVDDIIMFTTRSSPEAPFRGLYGAGNIESSSTAEIVWFVRGSTLYRRVLLIAETNTQQTAISNQAANTFYNNYDYSVSSANASNLSANTLADLSRRENRFGHWRNTSNSNSNPFPHPVYYNAGGADTRGWYYMRMPILADGFPAGTPLTTLTGTYGSQQYDQVPAANTPYWDFWENPNGWSMQDQAVQTGKIVGGTGTRAGEDIIMTNVLSFDVKVWNPYWIPLANGNWAPPQYVDLGQDRMLDSTNTVSNVNYSFSAWNSVSGMAVGSLNDRFGFCSKGKYGGSPELVATATPVTNAPATIALTAWTGRPMPCVYDTWTLEYERKPLGATSRTGTGVDGEINTVTSGGTTSTQPDQWSEWECPPPYITPLKGIEITIRCFDPRSKNIKQIRIVKDF